MFDEILNYRKDFPILDETKSNSVIYLDNTATTQKPKQVIQAMTAFLNNENATVHRGIYGLSQEATIRCDQIREDIKTFINAASVNEVIFTKGATESINLVATSYVEAFLQEGDEIIITQMEHHANIVPWQLVCEKNNLKLQVISISQEGELNLSELKDKCSNKTKFVAFTHISNVLGTVNPVENY